MLRLAAGTAVLLTAFVACARATPPTTPTPSAPVSGVVADAPAERAAGRAVDSIAMEVTAIANEYMAALLVAEPELATEFGLPGPHDRVRDNSLAALARWQAREDAWLRRVRALPADLLLGRPEWVTVGFLRERLESAQETRVCRRELWTVDQMTGWPLNYAFLAEVQPVGSDSLRAQAIARARALPGYIATDVANLREGVRRGYTSPRGSVQRVLAQVDGLLALAPAASPFYSPARRDSAAPTAFRRDLADAITTELYPALRRYREYLAREYLPVARQSVAVSALPGGAACYRAAARAHSSLDLKPRVVHELGLREMARIEAEMRLLAERSFGTTDVPALLERLRTDPQYAFRTREEIVALARAALERARTQARPHFGLWPVADVIVEPYPPFEEGSAPDSYILPSEDGTRPGRYRINTADPTRKPRAGQEASAFHETIPGHHLQGAIAQERRDAHPVTRFFGSVGFQEGWGLYAERLSEELGLYSTEVDRLGQLSNEAFRAARLVVDPGLHVLGWSRQRAIDYMLRHVSGSRAQMELEVDRYIIWPGQATAYMLGQLEILRLRAEARQALGSRFELRAFHDLALEDGALTLPMLRAKVEHWIASEQQRDRQ